MWNYLYVNCGPSPRTYSLATPWLVSSTLLRFTAVLAGGLFPWVAPREMTVMINPQYVIVSPIPNNSATSFLGALVGIHGHSHSANSLHPPLISPDVVARCLSQVPKGLRSSSLISLEWFFFFSFQCMNELEWICFFPFFPLQLPAVLQNFLQSRGSLYRHPVCLALSNASVSIRLCTSSSATYQSSRNLRKSLRD